VARRRAVELGADAVGFVIIAAGLEAGEEVIVLGQHSISDGDLVEVSGRDREGNPFTGADSTS